MQVLKNAGFWNRKEEPAARNFCEEEEQINTGAHGLPANYLFTAIDHDVLI